MYAVSEAFLEAMKKPVQHSRLRGSVKASAWNYYFTEDNIQKGSFSLTNQCSGNDNVEIGTVYIGELNVTFVNLGMQRYSLKDGVITPTYYLLTDDGWEPVPLGVYRINEANWTQWGVEITAYDNMVLFDKRLSMSSSSGRLYDFLSLACQACRVGLGMTEAEVNALPNGMMTLAVYPENDIETYRDLVSWCAQTAGGYATMDREGKLVIRQYGVEPVDTIDNYNRLTGAKFSDFETRYTGMSCVNIAEKTTTYYSVGYDDGLTYNLGSNPLLQFGTEEVILANRTAVLNALAVIKYVPCEVTMIGTPAYDLGDILVFSDGIADGEKISCITKFDWTFGGGYSVTCVGDNPALASARSKTDKDISGLMSQSDEDTMKYYNYMNAAELLIADGEKKNVIVFDYITTKTTHIDFHAEIKFTMETTEEWDEETYTENDGIVNVTYYIDGEEITDYHPVDTYTDGVFLLHLLKTWYSSGNLLSRFTVRIELAGGSMFIERGDCRAYIAGQGLVGEDGWDGSVHVDQEVVPRDFGIIIKDFEESIENKNVTPSESGMNQQITKLNFMKTIFKRFTDAVGSSVLHRFSVPYNRNDMSYENIVIVGDTWVVDDRSVNGTVTTPDCEVESIVRVTSEHSSNDVAYIVSFDGGDTWWTYANGWVEPDYTQDVYGMFEGTMRSITTEQWAEKLDGTIMIQAILVSNATLTDIQIFTEVYQ